MLLVVIFNFGDGLMSSVKPFLLLVSLDLSSMTAKTKVVYHDLLTDCAAPC